MPESAPAPATSAVVEDSTDPPVASTVPTTAPPATKPPLSTAAPSTAAPTTTPSTSPPSQPSPLRVGWVGGSEVALREVVLPALANELSLRVDDRPVVFEPFTTIAPSPADTEELVLAALDSGADALIVTYNPQWLYGRTCDGIEPPHTRYACLLADGPIVGDEAIAQLTATITEAGVPAVIVLTPTSADALESAELAPLIATANDRLLERIPPSPDIAVLDEALTSGRPEFAEGVGFHDMVHATPAGAALLADLITARLVTLLED
jgi:hypothetical protein